MRKSMVSRLVRVMAPVALASVTLGGCNMWYLVDRHFTAATIATAHKDVFVLSYDARTGTVDVSAPSVNADSNNRGVFWPAGQHAARDGETCARWKDEDHATKVVANIQEGAALRVHTNRDGSLNAITVTRNVWLDGSWIFNVNMWHVDDTYHPGLTTVLGANLHAVFGNSPRLPWDLCAKVVGSRLSFVVWPASQAKPAYGDATHSGTVTLPPNEVYAGYFGVYVGHLASGQSVDYDEMSVTRR